MKDTLVHPNLVTITRADLSAGYQIAQSCHSVADFAYYQPKFFNEWRTKSNYKICLASKDEQSLEKLYNKLKELGASVVAFREPDLDNQLTAITYYGLEEYKKYTKYLPLAGKNYVKLKKVDFNPPVVIEDNKGQYSSTARIGNSKLQDGGSIPPTATKLDPDFSEILKDYIHKIGDKKPKRKRL